MIKAAPSRPPPLVYGQPLDSARHVVFDKIYAMGLVHSSEAVNWLSQFDPQDRELAGLLLTSLTLVSHDTFQRGLIETIEAEAAKCQGPIALYAVREILDNEAYFPDKRQKPFPVKGKKIGSEGVLAYVAEILTEGKSWKQCALSGSSLYPRLKNKPLSSYFSS